MAQYIFGEVDVPRLDDDQSPISPFDVSRSMRLNSNNELVRTIYSFLGSKIEIVRRDLAEKEKSRKANEEVQKLAKQASEIAQVINEDFDAFRQRVAKAKAKVAGGSDLQVSKELGGSDPDDLLFGSQLPADVVSPSGGAGSDGDGIRSGGLEPRNLMPQVAPAGAESSKQGRAAGGIGERRKPSGGFQVSFNWMGLESHRAQYVRDERTIYINLDHPQLAAAKGTRPVDDPVFRRLAYEVAFSEYAVALASELAARDEYLDPSDPIVDIRETLNRIARRGARLYSD
jgi:hypothetical protein